MKNKTKHHKLKIILITLLVITTIYSTIAGHILVQSDPVDYTKPTDVIILMGSIPDRTLGAFELASQFDNARIYIVKSGMNAIELLNERGVDIANYADLAAGALVDLGYDADRVTVIDGAAESTIDEARILRDFLVQHGHADNLVVVTSKYHSRRSNLIFSHVLKDLAIDVHVYSTPYDSFDADRWFLNREDIQSVIYEHIKLLHFLLIEQWQR